MHQINQNYLCMVYAFQDRTPRPDVLKQQREGYRHGGQKREAQQEGTEGGQERVGARGGAHRGDVQDDFINGTAWGPPGPYSGDDDTRERKRRETVTEAAEERYLEERTREGGSKGEQWQRHWMRQMTCIFSSEYCLGE